MPGSLTTKGPKSIAKKKTVDLVIFACLDYREFVILGLFTKFRTRKLSISMIGSTIIIIFREILIFANSSFSRNSRKLKPREYYQIYSINNNIVSKL